MKNEHLSIKEFYNYVLIIIIAIAFIETSAGPVWSLDFLREFLPNVIIYIAVAIIAVLLLESFKKR